MVKPAVVFKGTRDGLVIVLDDESDFSRILGCLEERLDTARDFTGRQGNCRVGEKKTYPRGSEKIGPGTPQQEGSSGDWLSEG